MTENKQTQPARQKTGLGIRSKLMIWMLVVALVPLIIVGYTSYNQSSKALIRESFSSLASIRDLQKKGLEDYFAERTKNLQELNKTAELIQQAIISRLVSIRDLKKRELEAFLDQNLTLIKGFASSPLQKETFSRLVSADGSPVDTVNFTKFYKKWMQDHKFSSVILAEKSGKVLFSNDKFVRTGMSLKTKKDTPEYTAFSKGQKQGSFTDFSPSSLRKDEITAYFSTPLKINGAVKGVFLFRITDEVIDEVLKGGTELGGSGDILLVGRDRMLRSNSVYFEEKVLVNPAYLVDTEAVDQAFEGKDGAMSIIDFRGEHVLSAYTPIDFAGVKWALFVEFDQIKAMAVEMQDTGSDFFATFRETYDLGDIYLITPDGFILYTVGHKPDFETNILTGPYAESGLNNVVVNVLKNKDISLSDFNRYEPSDNVPAAFIASPLLQNNEVSMIVAMQLRVDPINAIMRGFSGNSETGDAYIVGPDQLFRSDSLHLEKYNDVKATILNPAVKVNTTPVQEALAGKSGTAVTRNANGTEVLASWTPFSLRGLHWALVNEISKNEIFQPISRLFKLLTLFTAAGAGAALLLSFFVSAGITRQVRAIMDVITKVDKGDLDARAEVISNDELGTMASAFNAMISATKKLLKERQEEHEQLQNSIIGMLEEISTLSEGDLSVRATVRPDATGTVADSLNMMLNEFTKTIETIKHSSEQVEDTAQDLIVSTAKLTLDADSQATMINEAVGKINQMTQAIKEAAEKASQSAESSELSREAAIEGTRAVEDTSQAMEAIRGNVQDTARAIKRLGESSQEISEFAKTINEISDRTSILALNASIQAAAAGEEGRGFAVVAEEIQRLAERAAGSTRQIETLIKNILGEITEAGASMDSSIQKVVQGSKLSENALNKLQEINRRSSEVAELIDSVSQATGEQAEGSVIIARTMGEVGGITTKTTEETRATSSAMKDMAIAANAMFQSVSTFKLPETDEILSAEESGSRDADSLSLETMLDQEGNEEEPSLEALLEGDNPSEKA